MADEPETPTNPEPVAPTPQAPATPAPQVITMTHEELEAKLNERAAQVRRAEQAKAKPAESPKPSKKNDEAPQGLSPDEVQSMMRRQSAFDRAIGKANLDDDQVSVIETLFQVEKPTDVSEWVARKTKVFGAQKPATPPAPQTAATPATPAPAQAPQPATPHPAPTGSTQPVPPGSDLMTLSKSQQAAYVRTAGFDRRHVGSRENRVASRKIRQEFEKRLQDVTIRGPGE